MKVLCIKRDTKETSEDGIISSFVPSLLVEGSEYTYIGTYYYDKEYWHLEEFTGVCFCKQNFIPLSDIDETEMIREHKVLTNQ